MAGRHGSGRAARDCSADRPRDQHDRQGSPYLDARRQAEDDARHDRPSGGEPAAGRDDEHRDRAAASSPGRSGRSSARRAPRLNQTAYSSPPSSPARRPYRPAATATRPALIGTEGHERQPGESEAGRVARRPADQGERGEEDGDPRRMEQQEVAIGQDAVGQGDRSPEVRRRRRSRDGRPGPRRGTVAALGPRTRRPRSRKEEPVRAGCAGSIGQRDRSVRHRPSQRVARPSSPMSVTHFRRIQPSTGPSSDSGRSIRATLRRRSYSRPRALPQPARTRSGASRPR